MPRRSRATGSDPADDPYTPEELEVLRAVDAWRRSTGIRFPSVTDIVSILRQLGWRPPVRYDAPTWPELRPLDLGGDKT